MIGSFKILLTLSSAACLLVITPACASLSAQDLQDAVLSPSTPQARAEITSIIQQSTGSTTLTLSDISLTKSSRLPVMRVYASGNIGDIMNGRRTEKPDYFTLKTNGANCWLYDETKDALHALNTQSCAAA